WDDARRKMVGISRAGRLARDTALEGISPMVEELIGELGPDKVRAVLPILRELRGKLEQD
ncbi:MAG: MarR family transcriptional regulator, partial [Pseudomonadota bacterium]|nr:MarR family transcriptional regulator [Pseudomonadota bacterium]